MYKLNKFYVDKSKIHHKQRFIYVYNGRLKLW